MMFGILRREVFIRFNGAGMFPSQKFMWFCLSSFFAHASMGPGCFHPRNEKDSAPPLDDDEASMGPGCFHPRNGVPLASFALIQGASMGPGCFHPRNLRGLLVLPALRVASMGPGCFHPRNKSQNTQQTSPTR